MLLSLLVSCHPSLQSLLQLGVSSCPSAVEHPDTLFSDLIPPAVQCVTIAFGKICFHVGMTVHTWRSWNYTHWLFLVSHASDIGGHALHSSHLQHYVNAHVRWQSSILQFRRSPFAALQLLFHLTLNLVIELEASWTEKSRADLCPFTMKWYQQILERTLFKVVMATLQWKFKNFQRISATRPRPL